MEGLVIVMVTVSPWLFGSVEAMTLLGLYILLTTVAALYALRMLVEGRLLWHGCPLVICLGLILLAGAWQMVPLPPAMLKAISPQTAATFERLLPRQPEKLPLGQPSSVVNPPPGSTISLYPHATRVGLGKLLAALLLFVFVRNGFASPASLRRLSIVCCVNGLVLSLFAAIQYFTSSPGEIFWSIDTKTEPFGPFVCRNHFPFYVNICIALGFGWLCSIAPWGPLPSAPEPLRHGRGAPVGAFARRPPRRRLPNSHRPAGSLATCLWIGLCLSVMIGSVALSMSRGGLLSLLAMGILCSVLFLARSRAASVWIASGAFVLAGVFLANWMGSEKLERRIDTLWSGKAVESRFPLWVRSITLARDFPVWGTGLGTFEVVEPLTRERASDGGVLYDHAHNEYVEAAVEGGGIRLLLMLAGIGLVLRMSWRAAMGQPTPRAGLALGALLALVSVAIHSIGEFGIHIPAITVLVIVVAAHASSLATADRPVAEALSTGRGRSLDHSTSYFTLAPAVLAFIGLPLILCWQAWQTHVADTCSAGVEAAAGDTTMDVNLDQIALLQRAIDATPTDAVLHYELGQLRLALFQQRLLNAGNGESSSQPDAATITTEAELVLDQLIPALRHFVHGRDLCPLLPELQFALAANQDRFEQADAPADYLKRVQFLSPGDPQLWYLIGQQQLLDGLPDQAWRSWRRSLELADSHLIEIIEQASSYLTDQQISDQIIPVDPKLLLAAARHPKFSKSGSEQEVASAEMARSLFLQRALELIQKSRPAVNEEESYWLSGEVYRELGRLEAAINSYHKAVQRRPGQLQWRLELAKALYEAQRYEEARRQTRLILSRDPHRTDARSLLEQLDRR
jgi:tetratricopeptide (TPR) repeat protein